MSSPSVQFRPTFLSGLFPSALTRSSSLTLFAPSDSFAADGQGDHEEVIDDSPRWFLSRSPSLPISPVDRFSPPPSPGSSSFSSSSSTALSSPPLFTTLASPVASTTVSTPSSIITLSSSPPPSSFSSAASSPSPTDSLSSPPPSFPGPPSKRARRDASAGSGECEPVKRSHREIDADRRRKEAVVIRRLEGLTDLVLPARTKRGKVRKSNASRKLLVLEASAVKIEQLQTLVREMATAASLRGERSLRSEATGLDAYAAYMKSSPPASFSTETSTQRLMKYLDGCVALSLPTFARADVAMLVFNMDVERSEDGELLCGNSYASTSPLTLRCTLPAAAT